MSKRQRTTSQRPEKKTNWAVLGLAVASIAVVIAGVALLKGSQTPQPSVQPQVGEISGSGTATEQWRRALDAKQPTMVFMHSTDCIPCKDLMQVMDQVYPEYAGRVVLVDVDVYDEANVPLMQTLGLRSIPTTVFFNGSGQSYTRVGTMKPDELRKQIQQRALGG